MAVLRVRRLAADVVTQAAEKVVIDGLAFVYSIAFTCPAGYRAIVRDIQLSTTLGVEGQVSIVTVAVSGGKEIRILGGSLPAGESTLNWAGQVVLEAGDTMIVYTHLTDLHYYISGAQVSLQGP